MLRQQKVRLSIQVLMPKLRHVRDEQLPRDRQLEILA